MDSIEKIAAEIRHRAIESEMPVSPAKLADWADRLLALNPAPPTSDYAPKMTAANGAISPTTRIVATTTPADESGKGPAGHQPPPADIGPYPSPTAVAPAPTNSVEISSGLVEPTSASGPTPEAVDDTARLDFIERTFSGMTNRERYLPVQMTWGSGANGRTLREACDKYMKRDADAARRARGESND